MIIYTKAYVSARQRYVRTVNNSKPLQMGTSNSQSHTGIGTL